MSIKIIKICYKINNVFLHATDILRNCKCQCVLAGSVIFMSNILLKKTLYTCNTIKLLNMVSLNIEINNDG